MNIKRLITTLLEKHNLLETFRTRPDFSATFRPEGKPGLHIVREDDVVRITLDRPDASAPEIRIAYCLDRNWLPLHYTGDGEMACDSEDLWDRMELAEVLERDAAWAEALREGGYLDAAPLEA